MQPYFFDVNYELAWFCSLSFIVLQRTTLPRRMSSTLHLSARERDLETASRVTAKLARLAQLQRQRREEARAAAAALAASAPVVGALVAAAADGVAAAPRSPWA
jgi:hypothetical protein